MKNRSLLERIIEHQKFIAEVALLQSEVERDRPAALAALPASFGYRDMDSFIKALIKACRPAKRRRVIHPRKPQTKAASPAALPGKSAIDADMAKSAQVPSPAEPIHPSGTSLNDPKNFGLLPDLSLLDTASEDTRTLQSKLADTLMFAQQVLHTSGVPAAIWREWRQFEQKSSDALRSLNTVTRTDE